MRPLDETSGPWIGWSVQYNRKIHEKMRLLLGGGAISGTGEDADGDFNLDGNYDGSGEVAITRQYTFSTSGPENVGIPFLYRGRWDGSAISGEWKPIAGAYDGGQFEMWPEDGSLDIKLSESERAEPVAS